MRLLIGLLLFGALAAGDVARLHELADARKLFLLREALQQPGWNKADTLFYRGMVESRFGQESKGIDDLRFLASQPSPDRGRKAYEEVAAALVREGRYGEAADSEGRENGRGRRDHRQENGSCSEPAHLRVWTASESLGRQRADDGAGGRCALP